MKYQKKKISLTHPCSCRLANETSVCCNRKIKKNENSYQIKTNDTIRKSNPYEKKSYKIKKKSMIYVYVIKKTKKNYENLTQKNSQNIHSINYRFTSKTKTFLTISHFFLIFFCFCQFYQIKLKKKKTHTYV